MNKTYLLALSITCVGCAPSLSNRCISNISHRISTIERNQSYIENQLYHAEISMIEVRSNMQKNDTELQTVKNENVVLEEMLKQVSKPGESKLQPLPPPNNDFGF